MLLSGMLLEDRYHDLLTSKPQEAMTSRLIYSSGYPLDILCDQAFESASLWSRQHGSPVAVFVSLKAANEKLALVNHLRRQMVMQRDEQFLMTHHLSTPLRAIHRFEMGEVLLLEV